MHLLIASNGTHMQNRSAPASNGTHMQQQQQPSNQYNQPKTSFGGQQQNRGRRSFLAVCMLPLIAAAQALSAQEKLD